MTQTQEIHFGPYRLCGRNGPLYKGTAEIRLQRKALGVLWTLARQAGDVVTRNALLDAVWPGLIVGDEALAFQIHALRKALEDDPGDPKFLLTAHRVGFRLAGIREKVVESATAERFVGRESELAQMHARYTATQSGQRQIVFVCGEPGIGKTTLLDCFLDRLRSAQPDLRIGRGQCIEQIGASEPYLPLMEAVNHLARESPDEGPIEALRQAAPSWLAQMPALLRQGEQLTLSRQTHGTRHTRVQRELAEALEQLATDKPLVLVLEDLHWSDPSTLELIGLLAQRRTRARLLLLCSLRPADAILFNTEARRLQQKLTARPQTLELIMGNLSHDEAQHYLEQTLGAARVTPVLLSGIWTRTLGQPLFIRQIANYLGQHSDLSPEQLDQALPEGLRELINLQIGRLDTAAQQALEAASLSSMEFSSAGSAAALEESIESLETVYEKLAHCGNFIESNGLSIWPDGTVSGRYRFRHALYVQVLRGRLSAAQQVHRARRLAERLDTAHGARVGELAPELAELYERAAMPMRALHFRVLTARRSLQRAASDDVLRQVARGLTLLTGLPDSAGQEPSELALRVIAVTAMQSEHGHDSRQIGPHFVRIRELLERVSEPALIESALSAMWIHHHVAGRCTQALEIANRSHTLGRQLDNQVLECCGHAWSAVSLYLTGRPLESEVHSTQALELARQIREKNPSQLFEPASVALAARAISQCYLGYPERSRQLADEAIEWMRSVGNPQSECIVRTHIGLTVLMLQRAYEPVLDVAPDVVAFCQKHGHTESALYAQMMQQVARCLLEGGEQHLPELRHMLMTLREQGTLTGMPMVYCLEAECCIDLGRVGEARAALEMARDIIEHTEIHAWKPDWLRMQGELRLAEFPDATAEAEGFFLQALELARERKSQLLVLRAATSLARLWQKKKPHEAAGLLAATLAPLTEGARTRDVYTARELLSSLSAARQESAHPKRRRIVSE